MKLIHTSDWHLGRALHRVDLLEHQASYLDHLVDLARTERPDAVLVSGDVYDRAVPPVAAVGLLEDALRRLAELTQVVVISGNHDSATRLGFASGLMRPEIRLATSISRVGDAVELEDPEGGPGALVYPLPFLDVYDAAARFATEETPVARSHEAVLGAAMARVRADLTRRGVTLGGAGRMSGSGRREGPAIVVMAHAFVAGGQGSESERDLTVGGVDSAPASVFADADYVALGHLHGPQTVTGREGQTIRYSGSPLAFSFSEAGHTKSTAVVTLGHGSPRVDLAPAPVPRPLAQLSGTIAELESGVHDRLADAWLRITVTDPSRPDDLSSRIRRRFPHVLQLEHVPEGLPQTAASLRVTSASEPRAVTAQFIEWAGGAAITTAEAAEVTAALETLRGASAR
jgi:exonuclease SbcD